MTGVSIATAEINMMKARRKRDRVGCCFHDRESSESMSEKSLNFSSSQRVVREESVGESMAGGETWSVALLAKWAGRRRVPTRQCPGACTYGAQ
jgi:hypothetical protein